MGGDLGREEGGGGVKERRCSDHNFMLKKNTTCKL